jgi:hypothetical protein
MLADQATFICGHPKSGTSLLRAMLDSHSQLLVFPEETKFFRLVLPTIAGASAEEAARSVENRILGVFRWSADSPTAGQQGFLDRDYRHVDHDEIERVFRRRAASWDGDLLSLLPMAVLAYGEVSRGLDARTLRWVEKSPYNESYGQEIFARWPDARCIHVVRDPRDNYASYRRKHPSWSPGTFAFSWSLSVRRGRRNQQRFGAGRYRILRYEDLVLDPDVAIAALTEFLGIEDEPALRAPTRDGKAWGGNSMFGETFDGISRSPVGRSKKELDVLSRRTLEQILADEMSRLGYTIAPPLTAAERLAGSLARVKWRLRSLLPALMVRRFRRLGSSAAVSGAQRQSP